MSRVMAKRDSIRCLAVWVSLMAPVQFANGDDTPPKASNGWPQWRGPIGTGAATDASPPIRWNAEENVRWKTPLPGRGHSTPIVWGDRVFVTAAEPIGKAMPPKMSGRPGAHDNLPVDHEHRYLVIAIDRDSGQVRWQSAVRQSVPHEGGHVSASLASASPVTDGEHVWAHFGSHGLYCLDFEGNVVWEKQFGPMHSKHGHGEGSSPALDGRTLIINWDHEEQSFLVALDKSTGDVLWRRDRDEVTSWSSPIVIGPEASRQVVVCGTDRVRGYDLNSGDVIWECGGMSANIVATPVAADGFVYVCSSYEKQVLMAIRWEGAEGDITGSERVVWSRTRGTPYVPSPLLYRQSLYFLSHYQNIVTRVTAKTGVDAPGAMRLGPLGNLYASPVGADGHVYFTDLDGVTQVIADAEPPRSVAINRLGERVSASAAIAGDSLFLRGERHLFRLAEPEQNSE